MVLGWGGGGEGENPTYVGLKAEVGKPLPILDDVAWLYIEPILALRDKL